MPANEMETEIDELLEYLGVPNAEPKPISVNPIAVKPTQPKSTNPKSEFVRVRTTPSVELQQMAQNILHQLRGQPYGTKMPFKIDDKEYMAVLEEHIGGRVPGPHPGISLFEKSASNDIYNLSNHFYILIKS